MPGHGPPLAEPRRILARRAHALAQGEGAELWEELLAQAYASVASGRRAALGARRGVLPAMAAELGEVSPVEAAYRPTAPALAGSAEIAEGVQVVRAALARTRDRQARAGAWLIGPHRDEVQFLLGGEDARRLGSRGVERTLALALRTAEAEILERQAGATPLALRDDVLPELDEERRRRVVARALARARAVRPYRVEAGQVLPA